MIIFLTTSGEEFRVPAGDKVEFKQAEGYGSESFFEVSQEGRWQPVAQVRACEVVGWHILEETEEELEQVGGDSL